LAYLCFGIFWRLRSEKELLANFRFQFIYAEMAESNVATDTQQQSMQLYEKNIHPLNVKPCNKKGMYVLYWVQASPRVKFNVALELACQKANEHQVPVLACYVMHTGKLDNFPPETERRCAFMLDGLRDLEKQLKKERNIDLVVLYGECEILIAKLAENCCELIVDAGYMRYQNKWYDEVKNKIECKFTKVETNVVVPVELVSQKEEFAAHTIRRKIWKYAKQYLIEPECIMVIANNKPLISDNLPIIDLSQSDDIILAKLNVDMTVKKVANIHGGYSEAVKLLENFVSKKLPDYDKLRNIPGLDGQSGLSPYINFGHISTVEIILQVNKSTANKSVKDAFVEQLLVRRELSMNFVHYNSENYDSLKCLPKWATDTLILQAVAKRDYIYTSEQLEKGETHDHYWNACQLELVYEGRMHGYMRMYWGKKVLEWTANVNIAYNWLMQMNDKYELDGRDPNGFAGVAWVFGKHDRAHSRRRIFGTLRYMNSSGLERKYKSHLKDYVKRCYELAGRACPWSTVESSTPVTKKRKVE
ncbi:Deoxyribodipyrimidine photo-lyase, partial [Trichinella pseudospiralis]